MNNWRLSFYFLSILVLIMFFTGCCDIEDIVRSGNKEILKYCENHHFPPKFGLIGIHEEKNGVLNLDYFLYRDNGTIFNIILQVDRRGNIHEFWTMVDNEEVFLKTLNQ